MDSPFDVWEGTYSVLTNPEGQHCLWPDFAQVPAGWTVVHGPSGRGDCLAHVNAHWTDQRPRGLAAYLEAGETR